MGPRRRSVSSRQDQSYAAVQRVVFEYVQETPRAFCAVLLHGSILDGTWDRRRSDVDLLIVVRNESGRPAARDLAARLTQLEVKADVKIAYAEGLVECVSHGTAVALHFGRMQHLYSAPGFHLPRPTRIVLKHFAQRAFRETCERCRRFAGERLTTFDYEKILRAGVRQYLSAIGTTLPNASLLPEALKLYSLPQLPTRPERTLEVLAYLERLSCYSRLAGAEPQPEVADTL